MAGGHVAGWVLIVCAALAGCAAGTRPPPSSPSPLLGRELPSIKRRAIGGEAIDSAALRGRVVIVKFFAAYCAPCRRSLPALEAFHRQHRDVAVVGLSLDETLEATLDQVARYGLTFPVIHDPGGVLRGRFRVAELPVVFVADRAGTLVWVGGPGRSHAELDRAAEAVP